jgi:hypothetical protein
MDKKKQREKYSVGYKKPPRDTQFKPGRSGNPKGRPKKIATLPSVFAKELRTRVPIIKNGKRQKVSMLEAIVKQHVNKAAGGDSKAAAFVFDQLREDMPGVGDRLSDLVQEFRAAYSRRMIEDLGGRPGNDARGKDRERP